MQGATIGPFSFIIGYASQDSDMRYTGTLTVYPPGNGIVEIRGEYYGLDSTWNGLWILLGDFLFLPPHNVSIKIHPFFAPIVILSHSCISFVWVHCTHLQHNLCHAIKAGLAVLKYTDREIVPLEKTKRAIPLSGALAGFSGG